MNAQTLDVHAVESGDIDDPEWVEHIRFVMRQGDSHLVTTGDLPHSERCWLSEEWDIAEVVTDFCNGDIEGQSKHGLMVVMSPNDDQVPEVRDGIDGLVVALMSPAYLGALVL